MTRAVDGHVPNNELVDGGAVIRGRRDREVEGVLFGKAAPQQCSPDQMPHRINLILGAEHAPCIGDGLSELQKRTAYLLEARLIPVGNLEYAGTLLAHLERILQGVDLLYILRVRRIDQHAHYDKDVSRTDPLLGQGVTARAVLDRRGVLVLIDYLHRHEALARLG